MKRLENAALTGMTALARLAPPETAHRAAIVGLKALARSPAPQDDAAGAARRSALGVDVAGLRLDPAIGLAAGFDKDAEVPDACLRLGFGFVECGSITPEPQPGNPKPRVFRLQSDRALINRLGFNSGGHEAARARLLARGGVVCAPGVIGVNLGANKDSPDRVRDYVLGLKQFWGLTDYFCINVSSPNTPGLRDLQAREALEAMLVRIGEARQRLTGTAPAPPLFVKVAPDLHDDGVDAVAQTITASGVVDGLVVSNTTISRPDHLDPLYKEEVGGLSGRPLERLATDAVRRFRRATGGRFPIIGVGGVEDGASAYAKIRAGASAVQLYTALVYQGPAVVERIARELETLLAGDGFASLSEAVGADVPVG